MKHESNGGLSVSVRHGKEPWTMTVTIFGSNGEVLATFVDRRIEGAPWIARKLWAMEDRLEAKIEQNKAHRTAKKKAEELKEQRLMDECWDANVEMARRQLGCQSWTPCSVCVETPIEGRCERCGDTTCDCWRECNGHGDCPVGTKQGGINA